MADTLTSPTGEGRLPKPPDPANGDLQELQDLLIAAERLRLNRIEEQLANPLLDAPSIATILPESIRHRSRQDHQLADALAPIVDETLMRAVQRSPQRIADALSPIMGPAIRKAVATALESLLHTLNQAIDQSLTWRGWTWRWEAWRTGASFGEVVLRHTARYRVEHVFLIHRATGIRLAHASSVANLTQREDLAASMFTAVATAVQRFAKDAFSAAPESALQAIKMDDGLEMWVEQGPLAVLAAVIRGTPPPDIRTTLRVALEQILRNYVQPLTQFQGDTTIFESTVPTLQTCLLQELKDAGPTARRGMSPALAIGLGLLLLAIGYWGSSSWLEHQRWADLLDQARQEPGLHITSMKHTNGRSIVYGMRDPLAADPASLAAKVGLVPSSITFQMEPYLALAPELILRRAIAALRPPDSVHLTIEEAAGVGTLTASGEAPHEWIETLRKVGPTISGVTLVQYGTLVDLNIRRLQAIASVIESQTFTFAAGSATLGDSSRLALESLQSALLEGQTLARQSGKVLRLEIIGQASQEGAARLNQQLSLARAKAVRAAIATDSLPAVEFVTLSAQNPSADSAPGPLSSSDASARRVSLRLSLLDPLPPPNPAP